MYGRYVSCWARREEGGHLGGISYGLTLALGSPHSHRGYKVAAPCSIAKHTHTIMPILSHEVVEIVQHKRNRPTPLAAAKCLCHAGAMYSLQFVKLILGDDPQYPSQKGEDTPR